MEGRDKDTDHCLTCVMCNVNPSYCMVIGVIARYVWNCSEPDEHGVRYAPGISRDYGSSVLTSTTAGDVVTVYRVEALNVNCYGEVTAIQYCYRYDTAVSGETVFNWTVLIFEETNVLMVTKIYVLESHPSSLSEGECVNSGGRKTDCCDQEVIEGFDLQMNFVFGVTESAQGNTAGATLLGFLNDTSFSVQPEYVISSLQTSKAGQNLSVGSNLTTGDGAQTGLRMLWFVIGKLHACICACA